MISVIVPVYNVSPYIDECIQSIVEQSYKDIEIILINDGSLDDSKEKCEVWRAKDSRIKLIDKENEGQAICRNIGVSVAQGELITFIDSDDWIDPDMLQHLYDALVKYDADISMCEAYTQHSNGSFTDYSLQKFDRPIIHIQDEKDYLLTVRFTMWSKLYRKSLFTENKIIEPSIKFEDFATVPIVYALANKIACVDECLYYYRYRGNSTVNDAKYASERLKALELMMQNFYDRGMDREWIGILKRLYAERGIILMRQIYPLLSKSFQHCCEEYDKNLKKHFGIGLSSISPRFQTQCRSGNVVANMLGEYELAVFGSYNLMIIAKMIMNIGMPDFLENHYCFSGLVSAMSDADELFYELNLEHKSDFRCKHLVQDFCKTFAHKNRCEFKGIDFFVVDFLEERFDIGEISGHYFTISDAFMDIAEQIGIEYRLIDKFSEEANVLWKESCDKFIRLLKRYIGAEKVIIVRSLLAEGYGNDMEMKQNYDNIGEIRKTNLLLNEYYNYFIEKMPDAMVIEVEDLFCYYTDENFKHGCFPWHLSDRAYWLLRSRVLNEIKMLDGNAIDKKLKENHLQKTEAREKYYDILNGKKIVLWNEEEISQKNSYALITQILNMTNKTPQYIIANANWKKDSIWGVKTAQPCVLSENADKYYVIISSGTNDIAIEKKLEEYGYKKEVNYCYENEMRMLLDPRS